MFDPLSILQHVGADQTSALSPLWLFAALFLGTFVSEDAACVAAGALAARGDLSFPLAVASCFLGIVTGDLALYGVGRIFGSSSIVARLTMRFVSQPSLDRASKWLEQRGASAVFLSRFTTGLRLPTYLAAGFLKTNFLRFALYFVIAAAVWTPLVVGAAALSGNAAGGRVIVGAIVVFFAIRIAIKYSDRKRRRTAIGKIKRIWRWEFWPVWVFYIPVVCYVLCLAIRHRSVTAFASANPAIPSGGFVGESKDEIYRMLSRSAESGEYVLKHQIIRTDASIAERVEVAHHFLSSSQISFPVVLKPDAGERGKGVRIISSEVLLNDALAALDSDHILQEYFDGDEVSVFYYRFPSAEKGAIFSMTRKIFPSLTGDGVSSLEDLILRDPRAVCLAENYFAENRDRLGDVPMSGEEVRIIEIGTHSRGAIFVDGDKLRSEALERAIDETCRRIDGFYFGRFDIRYCNVHEFRSGRGFKIIELNGVTSESTNIYDPRYSLFDAYRILFAQWRLAFEIGVENRRRGEVTTSVGSLVRDSLGAVFG